MTPLHIAPVILKLNDLLPSWVGQYPFGIGLAIGSEQGDIVFTNSRSSITLRQAISPSRSAVNGIAGFSNYLAVSTRKEISVFGLPTNDEEKVLSSVVPHGAHTVIASSSGEFLAPLGPNGLAIIAPSRERQMNYNVVAFEGEASLYQLIEILPFEGRQYFVAACRSKGIGIIDYKPGEPAGFQLGRFAKADVVDIVGAATPVCPWAIIAAGSEGELLLCRNIVQQEPPIQLHYANLDGPVYRVFVCFGHIILLAPRHFYVLVDLAFRLVQPVFDSSNSPVLSIELPDEAVDGYIDGSVFVVASDKGLMVYNLAELQNQLVTTQNVATYSAGIPSPAPVAKTSALSQILTYRMTASGALPKSPTGESSSAQGSFKRFSSTKSNVLAAN